MVLLVRASSHSHIRGGSTSTSSCSLCVLLASRDYWLWGSNRFSCFLVIFVIETLENARMEFDTSNLNISSVMLDRVSGALAWCMSAGFLAMRARVLRAIPFDMSIKSTEVALFMLVFVARSPVRVPFDFTGFWILRSMRTLSAPSWVRGVISVIRRCETSFSLRVEARFWSLIEISLSIFIECAVMLVEHGRILFIEEVSGNFSDYSFSSLTYLF